MNRAAGLDVEDSTGPVSLAILALEGETAPAGIAESLGREVINVTELEVAGGIPSEPASTAVVMVWVPSGIADATLAGLVQWTGTGDRPIGLIGCATRGTRDDSERALINGFDDFVVGEVSVRELAARVRALSRRLQMAAEQLTEGPRFGSITLDSARHQMWIGGRRIILTRTELAVMSALVGAQGRAISRADILDAAWGDQNFEVGERAVDNVIMRLRRKLGDKNGIITVRGVGFRLADQ